MLNVGKLGNVRTQILRAFSASEIRRAIWDNPIIV